MPQSFADGRRNTTLSYLAGLLEGEGSFLRPPPSSPNQPAVVLPMTDKDVVSRAALLLEATCQTLRYRKESHHKTVYVVRVRGQRAVEVMEALRPLMGSRRQQQITKALQERTITTYRVPYVTEIARMIELKAAGSSRLDLAAQYGIHPRSVDRLLRGSSRPLGEVLYRAAEIEAAEEEIAEAVGGIPDLAWLAGIVEGEGAISPEGRLRVNMTDEDVMIRVAAMFGGNLKSRSPRRADWSPYWDVAIAGQRAAGVIEQIQRALGDRRRGQIEVSRAKRAARKGRGFIPPERRARNIEIAERLAAGEKGPDLAREYGMTHQNVYFIGKKYRNIAACPSGEGSACKAEHAGSNPAAASA